MVGYGRGEIVMIVRVLLTASIGFSSSDFCFPYSEV